MNNNQKSGQPSSSIIGQAKFEIKKIDVEIQRVEKKLQLSAKIIAVQEDSIEKAKDSNMRKREEIIEFNEKTRKTYEQIR